MAGYTRNDTPNNIADGNVINASDLDGEFDSIQTAFGTGGHTHDGTAGNGPQIATAGLADNAVTTAKIADANVTTAKIANSNVTLAKMAANSIDSDQYVDGSIDTAHIANDAVTGDKLANNIQIAGTLGVTGETTLTTHLNMGDNDIIKLGASADLQIYHDGPSGVSYINESGSGNFVISGTNLYLNAINGHNYLNATQGGAVNIFHNNLQKLATTSTGIDVTGELTATTVDATTLQIGNTSITATAAELNYNDITTLGTVEASKTVTADSSGNVTFPNSEKLLIGTGPSGSIEIYQQALTSSTGISHIEADQELRIKGDGISINDVSIGGGFTITDDGAFITGPLKNTGTLELSGGGIPGVIALSNSLIGTTYGNIKVYPGLEINSAVSNSDITFTGVDGGAAITALTLDMSEKGTAIFNDEIQGVTRYSTSLDGINPASDFAYNISMQMYYDGSDNYIEALGRGSLGSTEDVGDLYIQNNNNDHGVIIRTDDGSGGLATYFQADGSTGEAKLYHYGSEKLRTTSYGIDISGSVVADTHTSVGVGATPTPDMSTYQNFIWTLNANANLGNPSTEKTGQTGFFIFIQDGTGGHTLSLASEYKTAGGAGITLSTAPNAVDLVPYIVQTTGTILLGTPQLAFS